MSEIIEHPPAPDLTNLRQPTLIDERLLIIADIKLDGDTQTRLQLNAEAVADYADEMAREGVEAFPAIDVFADEENIYWLGDGFHRVAAARCIQAEAIKAKVFRGSRLDALVHNARANRKNGVTRTNADKRRSVEMLLAQPEFYGLSDRWIAQLCFVGNQLVGDVRRQFDQEKNPQPCESHSSPKAKRVGRDGKRRPPTSKKSNATKTPAAAKVKVLPETEPARPVAGQSDEGIEDGHLPIGNENQPQLGKQAGCSSQPDQAANHAP